MRVPWQTAPRWAHPEGLARKGWTQLADGGVEIPWSNGKGVITPSARNNARVVFSAGTDSVHVQRDGPEAQAARRCPCARERVEALAEAEVDQLLRRTARVRRWSWTCVGRVRRRGYRSALDEQLEETRRCSKMRVSLRSFKILVSCRSSVGSSRGRR